MTNTGISHFYFSSTGIYLEENIPICTRNIPVFIFYKTKLVLVLLSDRAAVKILVLTKLMALVRLLLVPM